MVTSSDLRLYVLDSWVKRRTELSTDKHLVAVDFCGQKICACQGGNFRTCWWIPVVRAGGLAEAADRYWEARGAAALAVFEAKT